MGMISEFKEKIQVDPFKICFCDIIFRKLSIFRKLKKRKESTTHFNGAKHLFL